MKNRTGVMAAAQAMLSSVALAAVGLAQNIGYSIAAVWTATAYAAVDVDAADVDAVEDTLTSAGHGLIDYLVGQWTTDDTLPSGLSLATDYWAVTVDGDIFQVADSLANALAGTFVALGDAGVGTHTFTPTALAGLLTVQGTHDDPSQVDSPTWFTVTTQAVSGAGSKWFHLPAAFYKAFRLIYTATSGQGSLAATFSMKESGMKERSGVLIDQGALTADYTSGAVPVGEAAGYSVYAVYTGAAAGGTLYLQGTHDDPAQVASPTWFTVDSDVIAAAGATWFHRTADFYPFFRLFFDHSGNLDSLDASFTMKG